jgi:VWFA-related protein
MHGGGIASSFRDPPPRLAAALSFPRTPGGTYNVSVRASRPATAAPSRPGGRLNRRPIRASAASLGGLPLNISVALLTLVALTALIGLGTLLSADTQERTGQEKPGFTLKENVHLVVVPVTVKDHHGTLVDNLTQDDFKVFEDGRQRPVQYFSNETTPLSTVILLDTGMSALSLDAVRSGLRALSGSFAPDDEQALILFDNTIRPAQDFTTQGDLVLAAADKALPRGTGTGPSILGGPLGNPPVINGVPIDRPGTVPAAAPRIGKRIDDALYAAAQQLRARPLGRRRVVVILSDGVNGSDNQLEHGEVMDALAASQVTVYAVSFGSGWALKRGDLLARVTRDTGGDIAYVRRRNGLDRAFPELTNEARNSYVLGFSPLSADGRFHEIEVRVRRSGVRWIARNRFLSPPVK